MRDFITKPMIEIHSSQHIYVYIYSKCEIHQSIPVFPQTRILKTNIFNELKRIIIPLFMFQMYKQLQTSLM
jgi:hypothetical protein